MSIDENGIGRTRVAKRLAISLYTDHCIKEQAMLRGIPQGRFVDYAVHEAVTRDDCNELEIAIAKAEITAVVERLERLEETIDNLIISVAQMSLKQQNNPRS